MASISSKLKSAKQQSQAATKIPHLIIEARAGTGKTTTLIEGLKRLKGVPSDHPASQNPSPQQSAIWDALLLSQGTAKTVAFVAFNKAIADELRSRVPSGCDAMTSHSLGLRAVTDTFGRLKINNDRVQEIISELTGVDIWELRKSKMVFVRALCELVDLCKQNLSDTDNDSLDKLCSHYDVELDRYKSEVFQWVPRVMERCLDVSKDKSLSFTDMIWLPVAHDLPMSGYDLLLVDEAQDLNRCQQALIRKAGKRLVLCGDPKQAIYLFAGADSDSIPRMYEELSETPQGCVMLPLNYTRRCGKAIVREANAIVPDFYACEENPDGLVSVSILGNKTEAKNYRDDAKAGDMILCRVNAPLVSECFKFLKAGRKANIQGRDIGAGLVKTITTLEKKSGLNPYAIGNLISDLEKWRSNEEDKENRKKFPSESRILAINDRHDCLQCFCEDATTVKEVITKIESIFSDSNCGGIRLSSVHKSKGLEASRVFLLEPEGAGIPHPMAKTKWAIAQEWNLRYVAITRAINELVYVS